MDNILVIGKNGQLAKALARNEKGQNISFLGQDELDLRKPENARETLRGESFEVLINTSAFTAVDLAEDAPVDAFDLNATAVEMLAKVCAEKKAIFIHVSTDYVFGDVTPSPICEDHDTHPWSVYGKSKLAGEEAIREYCPQHVILRTSWLYGPDGKNFMKTMLSLAQSKKELSVVFDQLGSPTLSDDLAKAILKVAANPALSKNYGTYHYSNEGVASWYDFAKAIFEISDIDIATRPVTSDQFKTPARRPSYSVLNKQKIKDTFDLEIPYWRDSLTNCLKTYNPKQ